MKKTDLKSFIKENIIDTLNESPSSEEIRMARQTLVRFMKYRNVEQDEAIRDLMNALEYLKTTKVTDLKEDMDDEDDVDAKAIKAAKGARGKHKKLDLAVKALKSISTEMKSLARKYSAGDEAEKEKIKDILRIKTPQKKELESLVAKLEKDVV
tara:strand:+ start:920 stop:1381 length:462 start_codon:yes stop_codon:yes gene_type:complete